MAGCNAWNSLVVVKGTISSSLIGLYSILSNKGCCKYWLDNVIHTASTIWKVNDRIWTYITAKKRISTIFKITVSTSFTTPVVGDNTIQLFLSRIGTNVLSKCLARQRIAWHMLGSDSLSAKLNLTDVCMYLKQSDTSWVVISRAEWRVLCVNQDWKKTLKVFFQSWFGFVLKRMYSWSIKYHSELLFATIYNYSGCCPNGVIYYQGVKWNTVRMIYCPLLEDLLRLLRNPSKCEE
jgi:hypothetical protein